MNRDDKAGVIDRVAADIQGADAIFAIDYRGISVKQAKELRRQLTDAGASFQVVKNRLTIRAADKAGAEDLKQLLEGPTAFTYVAGDPAVAAKAIATFRRQNGLLEFKGGTMAGEFLTVDQLDSLARLPARDVLHAQFVGVLASPVTGLVRGLASMIGGLASQLGQIRDQGLVAGGEEAAPAEEPAAEEAPAEEEPAAEEPTAEGPTAEADDPTPAEEAPGDPVAAAETAEQEQQEQDETSEAPSEGGTTEPEEG
ncbi:MAG: large subunit ribosomal protein [Thermoleophilaceae bacterium]|nr:large subunit ribosomal protein [Thermoleophilaceae bacterium]